MGNTFAPEQISQVAALIAFVSINHMDERNPDPEVFSGYAQAIGSPVEVFDYSEAANELPIRMIRIGTFPSYLVIDMGRVSKYEPMPNTPNDPTAKKMIA